MKHRRGRKSKHHKRNAILYRTTEKVIWPWVSRRRWCEIAKETAKTTCGRGNLWRWIFKELHRNEPDRLIRSHQYLEVVRSAVELAMYVRNCRRCRIRSTFGVLPASLENRLLSSFPSKQVIWWQWINRWKRSSFKAPHVLKMVLAGKGNLYGKQNDLVDRSQLETRCFTQFTTAWQVAYPPVNAEKHIF